MRLRILVIAALGAALALYLIAFVGIAAVLSAAAAVGWGGFAILCFYAMALFLVLGMAWRVLQPGSGHSLWVFVWARMVRDAATEVLPFSQLGGIVFGARAAITNGIETAVAFASTVVDVTAELMAQIVFVAIGLGILSASAPPSSLAASLSSALQVALAVAAFASVVLLALQRHSLWLTGKLATRALRSVGAASVAVAAALNDMHRSPARIGLSGALHLAAWIASAVGTWIAFRLIGVHVGLLSVLAIESLISAVRSVAVIVPNALGVQEAAYALLAPLFGVAAEFGLAVSLLKRARDIALGVPIVLIWHAVEGRRAIAKPVRL
jgi:glycosyltransferase 2 family protein